MLSSQQQAPKAISRMLFYYIIIKDSIFRVYSYTILTPGKSKLVSMTSGIISGKLY